MDVGGRLRSLGLDQYEANFRDNKIDADVLPQLTADDLKDIGVSATFSPIVSGSLVPCRRANHGLRRRPLRPFGLSADDGRAAKIERFLATDAHRLANCAAAGPNQIEPSLADVHDDRARPVRPWGRRQLAKESGVDL